MGFTLPISTQIKNTPGTAYDDGILQYVSFFYRSNSLFAHTHRGVAESVVGWHQ